MTEASKPVAGELRRTFDGEYRASWITEGRIVTATCVASLRPWMVGTAAAFDMADWDALPIVYQPTAHQRELPYEEYDPEYACDCPYCCDRE